MGSGFGGTTGFLSSDGNGFARLTQKTMPDGVYTYTWDATPNVSNDYDRSPAALAGCRL
jgi:hypothetical protein